MSFTPTQLRLAQIDVEQRYLEQRAAPQHLAQLGIRNSDEGRADVVYILEHIRERIQVLNVIRGRLKETRQ